MNIYTKTGDTGETSLIGNKRVKKNCLEIDAIGDIDETNALMGVLITSMYDQKDAGGVRKKLIDVQHALFVIGSNVAAVQMNLGKMPQIKKEDVLGLEQWIDDMEKDLHPLTQFILPGGTVSAAQAFLVRALCRRAERRYVELVASYPELNPLVGQYLNRLSDVLFVLGRWLNKKDAVEDVVWKK